MNLFFFNPQTLNYEMVRENVDDLEAGEINSTIIEYFYENGLDVEAGNILNINSFETTCNLYYEVSCEKTVFCFILSEQERIELYNTMPVTWDSETVTITTTTGESYEL